MQNVCLVAGRFRIVPVPSKDEDVGVVGLSCPVMGQRLAPGMNVVLFLFSFVLK